MMKTSMVSKRNNTLNDESEDNSENNDKVLQMMPLANPDEENDDNDGAKAIILSNGGKGDRHYRLSTGSNFVYDEGRKSARVDFSGRTSAMIKGSKEDSKSMLLPSTDRSTSQKSNMRNAKSMMMSYEAPETATADLITRDDGFNLGLGRDTVRNGVNMNLSEGEIIPGALDGAS